MLQYSIMWYALLFVASYATARSELTSKQGGGTLHPACPEAQNNWKLCDDNNHSLNVHNTLNATTGEKMVRFKHVTKVGGKDVDLVARPMTAYNVATGDNVDSDVRVSKCLGELPQLYNTKTKWRFEFRESRTETVVRLPRFLMTFFDFDYQHMQKEWQVGAENIHYVTMPAEFRAGEDVNVENTSGLWAFSKITGNKNDNPNQNLGDDALASLTEAQKKKSVEVGYRNRDWWEIEFDTGTQHVNSNRRFFFAGAYVPCTTTTTTICQNWRLCDDSNQPVSMHNTLNEANTSEKMVRFHHVTKVGGKYVDLVAKPMTEYKVKTGNNVDSDVRISKCLGELPQEYMTKTKWRFEFREFGTETVVRMPHFLMTFYDFDYQDMKKEHQVGAENIHYVTMPAEFHAGEDVNVENTSGLWAKSKISGNKNDNPNQNPGDDALASLTEAQKRKSVEVGYRNRDWWEIEFDTGTQPENSNRRFFFAGVSTCKSVATTTPTATAATAAIVWLG